VICRNCGTEIADKALICYRCGTATSEPKHRPPAARPSTGLSRITLGLTLLLALILVVYVARASLGETPTPIGWAATILAVALLVLRVVARRRR
jgi:hypothetical protein